MIKVTEESMCKVDRCHFHKFLKYKYIHRLLLCAVKHRSVRWTCNSGGNKVLGCYNEWLRYVPGKVRQTVGT